MKSHTAQPTDKADSSTRTARQAGTGTSPSNRRPVSARRPAVMDQAGRRGAGVTEPGNRLGSTLPRLPRVTARTVVEGLLTPLPDASWPACLQVRHDGHLQVGTLRLAELAEIVGTPFILGDPQPDPATRDDDPGDHDPVHPVLVMNASSPVDCPAPRQALRDGKLLLVPLPMLPRSAERPRPRLEQLLSL